MAYNKTTWENAPSTNTPINAGNLNKIEEGIYQNSLKADQVGDLSTLTTTAKNNLVSSINEVNENLSTINNVKIYTGDASITFTAPFDGILDVTTNFSGWGYGGGEVVLFVNNSAGNATLLAQTKSKTSGHDNQYVPLTARAFFQVTKNTEYTFASGTTGNLGWIDNRSIIAKLTKDQNV